MIRCDASLHFSVPDGRSTRQARHYFVALARRAQVRSEYASLIK